VAFAKPDSVTFQRAIADLEHDDFAIRESAMEVLWEFHDEEAMESLVEHGVSAETRARAAIILDKFRWGIIPGVTKQVELLVVQFRDNQGNGRHEALASLAALGELRMVARLILRIENDYKRAELSKNLRTHWGRAVPAALARGRANELEGFLDAMAQNDETMRDRAAFHAARGTTREKLAEAEVGSPIGRMRLVWLLRSFGVHAKDKYEQMEISESPYGIVERMIELHPESDPTRLEFQVLSGNDTASEKVVGGRVAESLPRLKRRDPGAALDILVAQGRVTDALDLLGNGDAKTLLREGILLESAAVRATRYAKKALSLSSDSTYTPTGITQREGLRALISMCRDHGFSPLIDEAGAKMVDQLEKEEPFALAAFASWASRFPELAMYGVLAAQKAVRHGVPVEFAIGPVFDEWSEGTRWFAQFTTFKERRSLLNTPISPQVALAFDEGTPNSAYLPPSTKASALMANGSWAEAAEAFVKATHGSGTLTGAAVHAYQAALAYEKVPDFEKATKWRRIAETIPLADEEARAALADTMQRHGEIDIAFRQRELIINLRAWCNLEQPEHSPHYSHALRIYADSERALDNALVGQLLYANAMVEVLTDPLTVNLAQLIRDGNRSAQLRMVEALKGHLWSAAKTELWKAHGFAPGDPAVFELLVQRLPPQGQEGTDEHKLLASAARFLANTRALWASALERLPESPLCQRQLARCDLALEKLNK